MTNLYYFDQAESVLRDVLEDGTMQGAYPTAPAPYEGWQISGNLFYNPANPFVDQIRLSRSGASYLVVSEKGWGSIQSDIQWSTINSAGGTTREYLVAGDIQYQDASGTMQIINVSRAAIAPVGKRLVWYQQSDGTEALTNVSSTTTLAELNSQVPVYLRWATADEAASFALEGVLNQRYAEDVLKVAEAEGLYKQNGDFDYSSALWFLINSNLSGLRAYSRTLRAS